MSSLSFRRIPSYRVVSTATVGTSLTQRTQGKSLSMGLDPITKRIMFASARFEQVMCTTCRNPEDQVRSTPGFKARCLVDDKILVFDFLQHEVLNPNVNPGTSTHARTHTMLFWVASAAAPKLFWAGTASR